MLSPAEIRARYERVRAEVGPGVTVVAATKYVTVAEMAVLVEAGIEVVGENRAQDLEAKHAVYGDAFRWHFIGRLQSNKVKVINRCCELVHSLDTDSAASRLEIPALVQVNLVGEGSKGGRRARRDRAATSATTCAASRRCRPRSTDPEESTAVFRRLRELAAEHGLTSFRWARHRTTGSLPRRVRRMIRVGSVLFR